MTDLLPEALRPYAKAVAALLLSIIGSLIQILGPDGGLGDLTLVQWLGIVVTLLGPGTATYFARNKISPAEIGEIAVPDGHAVSFDAVKNTVRFTPVTFTSTPDSQEN